MITVLLFLVFLIVFFSINTKIFGYKHNYANIFLLLWCVIPMLSSFGFYDFYVPPTETYLYILLMILTFEGGTILFKKLRLSRGKIHKLQSVDNVNWKLMLTISVVCMAGLFPFFFNSVRYAMSNGYHALRSSVFRNEIISARNRIIIQDIMQPLIIVTTMISLYALVDKKRMKAVTVISLITCVMYMLTLANRALIMEILFLTAVFLLEKYALNLIAIIRKNKRVARIGIILVTGMVFITLQRSVRGSTGLIYDIYTYFVGSIHFFGVAVSQPEVFRLNSGNYLFGREFFSSVIGFMNDIALAFGKPAIMESGIGIINEVTQNFYFVSPTTHMNNNITMIYGFMRDFGVMGIIIDTFLLSFLYMKLYKRKRTGIYNNMMYLYGVSLLPYLIFEWIYARTYILITFIILGLFNWFSDYLIILKK